MPHNRRCYFSPLQAAGAYQGKYVVVILDQGMGNTHAVARLDDYPGDPSDDYVFFGVDIWWSVEE